MKKKLFYSILLMVFVWAAMMLTANAATYATYGDLTYYISDNEVTITDCSTYATSVAIPETIEGLPVTSIGSYAFYNCDSLESVTIGKGVTSIGEAAFRYCTRLTSITIPDGVTSISVRAFYDTAYYNDTNNWKNGVLYIGNHLIDAKTTVTAHVVKPGTRTIAAFAFTFCDGLTSITIPDSVTSIGDKAFAYCDGLTSITIPDRVMSIGDEAFYECASLTSIWWNARNVSDFSSSNDIFAYAGTAGDGIEVVFGDKVEKIPANAFNSALKLKSVTIGKNVTSIGSFAFSCCSGLTSITIPDSVTSIGDDAFFSCDSLESIKLPDSVTSIGSYAFYNCTGLESVYITDLAAYLNITYESSYSVPMYYAAKLYLNGELVTDLVIPTGVEQIPMYAFSACDSLESIKLPDSVTSIGSSAFRDCTSLASIKLPDSVTSIGSSAFYDCDGLTSITIPGSVTSIGSYAFYNCSSLTSITIPDSVTSIGKYAFFVCDNFESVYITDLAAYLNITYENWASAPMSYADKLYLNGEPVTDLVIPAGAKQIPPYAFDGCASLTSITIPDSVTSIDSHAFYGCDSLESVYITDLAAYLNITYENWASAPMSYADKLYLNGEPVTDLVIPAGAKQIPPYAFDGCASLTSITIPDSVTSIGSSAFYGCDSLESVYITDLAAYLNITYENWASAPMSYADKLYLKGKRVTNLVIPAGVEQIPDCAFYGCDGLESIKLPDSVTSIGEGAFSHCDSLESITIPDSVTSIGSNAFAYCTALKTLYWNPVKIASYGNDVFESAGNASDGVDVIFGDDVLRIPPQAFTGANIKTVALGGNVSMIDEEAFADCTGLEKLLLPKSIWEIEINAFSGCTNLTEVEYAGSAEDWAEVYIGTGNEALHSVTYKYDSKEANRLGVTLEETAAGRTFTVAPVAVEEGTVVYAAIYDKNGELISLGCETVDADNYTTVETQSTLRDAVAKVFLFSGAKAQTESKTYPLS